MIYPGSPGRVGISGVGGPIASMRLKMWRQAVEDVESFMMLETLTDKSTVDAIVSGVVTGFSTNAGPYDYANARKAVAEMILDKMGKK